MIKEDTVIETLGLYMHAYTHAHVTDTHHTCIHGRVRGGGRLA